MANLPNPGGKLKPGCYLICYTPAPLDAGILHYDGTLRVQQTGPNDLLASGDLYAHFDDRAVSNVIPTDIPIFPCKEYRFYLWVTGIGSINAAGFTMDFELKAYNANTEKWGDTQMRSAALSWITPVPQGYPPQGRYLSGPVSDRNGTPAGTLTMGWLSDNLRRAKIEIDRVPQAKFPRGNGKDKGWTSVFKEVGWKVEPVLNERNVPEENLSGPDGSWSLADLHAWLLQPQNQADLDAEWRYLVVCVRSIEGDYFGVTWDPLGGDSPKIVRDVVGIAAHEDFPAEWVKVREAVLEDTPAYFRTAVHEIGHAMNLDHNDRTNGFMNETGKIAWGNAAAFPDNIVWAFDPAKDGQLLRHLPDVLVRPGTPKAGGNVPGISDRIAADQAPVTADGLELRLTPLSNAVPLGAPVRVKLKLVNTGRQTIAVPPTLALKSGYVRGQVRLLEGEVRTFRALVQLHDNKPLLPLPPGRSLGQSMTLLRGAQGALFPVPGAHRLRVEVTWSLDGVLWQVQGETAITVTEPVDDAQAQAAERINSSPEALLSLALGGDHLEEGNAAIEAALSHPVLHPHYAVIKAKRLGKQSGPRAADVLAACQLLGETTVLSDAEIRRVAEFLLKAEQLKHTEAVKRTAANLKERIAKLEAEDDVVQLVNQLEAALLKS
ncbi:MAG: hypothetical protein HY674_03845 [Chloroflexi bacterium]|nr:hypothetical protein [Chloroflexota bacterium]